MAVEEVRLLSIRNIISTHIHSNISLQEFSIEIPDAEADEIKTVQQGTLINLKAFLVILTRVSSSAIDYIAKTPEGTCLS